MPLDPEQEKIKQFQIDYINRRWSQLHSLQKEWAEVAIKYLFYTNSGGAVAVLSFMGSSEEARAATGSRISLVCFGLGILLVGVFHAFQYHRISGAFEAWKVNSRDFLTRKVDWDSLNQADDQRSRTSVWAHCLAYSAFAAFIVGCLAGFCSLLA